MKKTTTALACVLLGLQHYGMQAYAAQPVPVVERTPTSDVIRPDTATAPVRQASVPAPRMVAQQSAARSANAEMLMLLEQLQEEVRYLRGQVEEQAHRMKKMRTSQRDRYRDLDRRISALSRQAAQPAPVLPATPINPAPAAPATAAPATDITAASAPSDAAVPAPRVTDRQAYKQAFALVRKREFEKSLTAFGDFIRFYPESSLIPNALYWTGEVYRARPEPDQLKAREAYQQLVAQFPQHQKSADALYKLGLTWEATGEHEKAREVMNRVITLYPGQSSARLAKDFLSKSSSKKQ